MATANSRNQLGFVQAEVTWGTAPNTTGTSTVANGDAFLFESLLTNLAQEVIDRPDKTGILSAVQGINGKKASTWSMRCALALAGSAGVVPDIDAILAAAMGQAGVIVGATSVTYSLADASPSFVCYNYYDPAAIIQELILAAIVQRMTIEWGGNVPMIEFSGQGITNDSGRFSTSDATEKGGLTSFPARPAAPVTVGTPTQGYKGIITLDGVSYTTFRSGSITADFARELPGNVYNSDHPSSPAQGVRDVRFTFELDEEDTAGFKALLLKAQNKTVWDATIQIGTVAGSILSIALKRLQFDAPPRNDGQIKLGRSFSGKAHGTATLKDEIALVLT
jgi:hypothetical protein